MSGMSIASMKPGDVLLFHGRGLIGRAIRLFDGTDYNHSALVLNEGHLAESDIGGVQSNPLKEQLDDAHCVLVRRLSAPVSCDPVIIRARHYLDLKDRYAYEALLLLAVLSVIRRVSLPLVFRVLFRKILDAASALLLRITAASREPMICSEFVHRCYGEAAEDGPSDPYNLDIDVSRGRGDLLAPHLVEGAWIRGTAVSHSSLLAARLRGAPRLAHAGWLVPDASSTEEAAAELMSEIEGALPAYFEHVEQRDRADDASPEEFLAAEGLERSLDTFLVAAGTAHALASLQPMSPVQPGAVDLRWISDLVTPGDLRYSPSLMDIGMYYP